MKRAAVRHPYHFQLMLGNQLGMQQTSQAFRDLLSAFRIAPSRDHATRAQCSATVKSLMKGVQVQSHDMCLLNGDNIGHVIKGKEASYKQRTLFQDIIVRKERLEELSIHCQEKGDRISRVPANTWLDLVQDNLGKDELAQDTVVVNEEDYKTQ